jgi:hypothetical protein
MLADHRAETLKIGAAVCLLLSGRLDAVLPLDDAKRLAHPMRQLGPHTPGRAGLGQSVERTTG